jgi:hypothetical protein
MGSAWPQVAKLVPSRTARQCRDRWPYVSELLGRLEGAAAPAELPQPPEEADTGTERRLEAAQPAADSAAADAHGGGGAGEQAGAEPAGGHTAPGEAQPPGKPAARPGKRRKMGWAPRKANRQRVAANAAPARTGQLQRAPSQQPQQPVAAASQQDELCSEVAGQQEVSGAAAGPQSVAGGGSSS